MNTVRMFGIFLNLAVKSKILLNIVEESLLWHFPKFIGEEGKFLTFECDVSSGCPI